MFMSIKCTPFFFFYIPSAHSEHQLSGLKYSCGLSNHLGPAIGRPKLFVNSGQLCQDIEIHILPDQISHPYNNLLSNWMAYPNPNHYRAKWEDTLLYTTSKV